MTLRVAIVAHAPTGGSGVVARDLAHILAADGHDVRVLSPPEPRREYHDPFAQVAGPRFGQDAGAPVRQVEVRTPDHLVFDHPPSDLAMASEIARQVDDDGVDVVHVHYAVPWAVSAALARQWTRRPFRLVVTLHGTDVTALASMDSLHAPLRWALSQADALIAPSCALRDEVVRVFGTEMGERVRVIRNWVDAARFHPLEEGARAGLRARLADELCLQESDGSHSAACSCPGGPLRDGTQTERWLVHVSNFRPVKQAHLLADVFERVALDPRARLLLVGDGPDVEPLVAALIERGLGARVVRAGHVSHPAPWVQAADVFVLPSAQESFGLAALEAMACAVPVVAFAVGGLGELIAAEEGVLVPAGDVSALAQSCSALLFDDVRRAELGEASLTRARTAHTTAQALAEHLAVYGGRGAP